MRWDNATPQFRTSDGADTFLIERHRFDQALLTAAGAAGVQIHRPAWARRFHTRRDGWVIEVMSNGVPQVICAAFLVIAAGKNAVLARPRQPFSAPTIALSTCWQHHGVDVPGMLIDVGTDWWCWGCTLPTGVLHTVAFVDRHRCPGGGQVGLRALYGRLLATSPLLAQHGEPAGSITAHDATPSYTHRVVGPRFVCIGDAAMTLDPLSSQGVQAALSTALQGSLVAHTILTVPAHTTAAIQFYEERCRQRVTRHQRQTAQVYAQQTVYPHTDFWRRRQGPTAVAWLDPPTILQHRHGTTNLTPLLCYRLAEEAQLVELPAATGDIISLQPSLVHPVLERPLTYVNGLPIVQILSVCAGTGGAVHDVLQSLSTSALRRKYASAIRWLIGMGIVIPAESPYTR